MLTDNEIINAVDKFCELLVQFELLDADDSVVLFEHLLNQAG